MRLYYDKLFQLMEDRKITNRQLSSEANIPFGIIINMQCGYNVEKKFLCALMDYLKCSWQDIIDYKPDEEELKPTETQHRHRGYILQYTKDGKLVGRWKSAREAGRELDKEFSAIIKCCNGERKSAYGFIWKWEDNERK